MNLNNIRKIITKGSILEMEPMAKHTSFKVGGPAHYFITPHSVKELSGLVSYLKNNELKYYVIGNGSNLLVSDRGYDGVIIDLSSHDGTEFTILGMDDESEVIRFEAGAGSLMGNIGRLMARFGAKGFEPLSGIPGCIGGACTMNAGAYGGEMKDIVTGATVLDPFGKVMHLDRKELDFSYRHSAVQDKGYIVAKVEFELERGDEEEIKALMADYAARRREKQPLEYPSAGSTFKRPEGNFAGKLIEEAGLSGYSLNGAAISEKHCGFVINKGGATASDIYKLIENVRDKVYKNSGIMLEPEVRMLGEF